MTDIMDTITPEARSLNMMAIRSKDTKPELIVRKLLHAKGYRYSLNKKELLGKPDIFLRKYNSVIFVHGCFWHQHKDCKYATRPKSNKKFWNAKLDRNIHRDAENKIILKASGYRVLTVWECETKTPDKLIRKMERFLNGRQKT